MGRDRELATIRDFLDSPAPGTLAIDGPPGIGKTTLWRIGVAEACERGRRMLEARPLEAEAGMAWAGLQALLAGVFEDVADELPDPQRMALEVALLLAAPGRRPVESRAVGTGTLSALRALSRDGSLLVAIDDLQWLDRESAGALRFALNRLGDADVIILIGSRPGGEDGLATEPLRRVELGPLDVESLRALAREQLEVSLSLPAGRRLAELSGGNPFYALELARAASRNGAVDLDAVPAASIEELVGARLARVPAATRAALATLAALARPRIETVADALGDRAGDLDPAFAAGLLEDDRGEIRFAHPLLAAAAYGAVPPARRRSVHRRLAEIVEEEDERARHLALGTVRASSEVATAIAGGGTIAARRGTPSAAGELLEAAARLTPKSEPNARAKRILEAARQHDVAGDGARAVELCRGLIAELPPGDLRAEALTTMAWRGMVPIEEGIAMGEQAIAECKTAVGRAHALLLMANVVQTNDLKRALGLTREAVDLLGGRSDPALRAYAIGQVGGYLSFAHPEENGVEILREAVALEAEHGVVAPDAYLSPATALGLILFLRDELDEARDLLVGQYRAAREAGQEAGASGVALHLAELECRAGDLARAAEYAEVGLAAADEGVDSQELGSMLYASALIAAHRGEVERARELATRGVAVGRRVGDRIFPILNRSVLGFLDLSLGDFRAAVEYLDELTQAWHAIGYTEPGSELFTRDRMEALVATGRLDDAEEVIADWEALGKRLQRPRVIAIAARGRGLIDAARGDVDGGLGSLRRALEVGEQLPVPHERARSLLALGTNLRRAGRRRDARAALDEAKEIFSAIGEPLWAARARREAERLGGRAPAGEELTPAERRVAELVAEGRSNREVADTLYVTIRTVEANLTRIYRKLGIGSRRELIANPRLTRPGS